MQFKVLAVLPCLALAGCAPTSTKEPILLQSVQTTASIEAFTNELLAARSAKGYFIKEQTPNLLIMDKPANGKDDFAVMLFMGSDWAVVPNYRLTYQFTGSNPMTVYVNGKIITNPGTGFERPTDFNNHPSMNVVIREMQEIAKRLETKQ